MIYVVISTIFTLNPIFAIIYQLKIFFMLDATCTKLLRKTVSLQFKTIQTRPPQKLVASAVHLSADEANAIPIMKWLNKIYSKDWMNNCTADYPLRQCLLLAPMAKGLNNNNLASCLQLKAKQSSFCNQVVTVTTWAVSNLDTTTSFSTAEGTHHWSLRGLFMQVAHPTNATCVFFQAINNYSVDREWLLLCYPAWQPLAECCNWTHWLLELVYGKWHSHNLDLAFHPSAIQDMALIIWDENHNCVQQKEGDLLGWALKDLDIYNLWLKVETTPLATVLVDTTGMALQEKPGITTQFTHHQASPATQAVAQTQHHNNDSLTNSIQSQNTMFTQAIHQMDTLAKCQAAFENNTQTVLERIMNQLAELTQQNHKRHHNWNYSDSQQDYDNEDSWSWVTANDSMEKDVGET